MDNNDDPSINLVVTPTLTRVRKKSFYSRSRKDIEQRLIHDPSALRDWELYHYQQIMKKRNEKVPTTRSS